MGTEPMELAKNLGKLSKYPAFVQIKYDGVPIVFRNVAGIIVPLTRQNELAKSVGHICEFLAPAMPCDGDVIIGECFLPGRPFKESSGAVRTQGPRPDLLCIIFDGQTHGTKLYADRIGIIRSNIANLRHPVGGVPAFVAATLGTAYTPEDYERIYEEVANKLSFKLEGLMGHWIDKPFQPGKRCWGMTRYKPQPTIDLKVTAFMEAISETGEPLGMVGRIECELRRVGCPTADVGVGPGKLSHAERRAIWQAYMEQRGRVPADYSMLQVKYMPDKTYDKLRQPTAQRFRPDKTEPDVYDPE